MKKETYRYIILIPHRDFLRPLYGYRAKLFSMGFPGAWSFPMAAPLASVSRHFSTNELKELGRNTRDLTKGTDGKILCSGNAHAKFTTNMEEDISFFGVPLNLLVEETMFPKTARTKILDIFSPPVLCAALLASNERPPSEEGPALSFRAASLANLAIRPLESGAAGYSFEWKMGPFIWLPKYKGG